MTVVSGQTANLAAIATKPVREEMLWRGHMCDGLGHTYGPEPQATLSANSREITLSGPLGTFRIPSEAVALITRGGFYPWFLRSVRIRHRVSTFPKTLEFHPQDGHTLNDVFSRLREFGYR